MDFSFWPKNCKSAFHKCGPKQTCQNSNRWKSKLKFDQILDVENVTLLYYDLISSFDDRFEN